MTIYWYKWKYIMTYGKIWVGGTQQYMGIGMVVVHGYTWQNMAIQGYGDIWQYIGIHGIIKN